jgi:hypothetical protein
LAGQLFLNLTGDFLFHDLLFEWIFMKSFSKVHLNNLKFGLYDLLHLLIIKLLLPLLIFFLVSTTVSFIIKKYCWKNIIWSNAIGNKF